MIVKNNNNGNNYGNINAKDLSFRMGIIEKYIEKK
jgi:hypothetical protein